MPSELLFRKDWKIEAFDYDHGDLNELLGLFTEEYGAVDPAKPEYFQWYCQDNPAGKAVIPLARDPETGKLVGQFWAIPLRAKFPEGEFLGSVGMNALVAKANRRQGIISQLGHASPELIKARGIDFSMIFPNRRLVKTRASLPEWLSIGFLSLYTLPLDVRLFDRTRLRKNPFALKLVKLLTLLMMPLLFRARKFRSSGSKIQIQEISSFDERFDQFWEKIKDKYPVLFVRDSLFLRWRYTENPCRQYTTLVALEEGEMVGYLILRCGQIRKFPVGAVLDILVEPSPRGDLAARMLVKTATDRFHKEGMYLAVSVIRRGVQEERALRLQGYVALPGAISPQQVETGIKLINPAVPTTDLLDLKNWYLTLGDFDIV